MKNTNNNKENILELLNKCQASENTIGFVKLNPKILIFLKPCFTSLLTYLFSQLILVSQNIWFLKVLNKNRRFFFLEKIVNNFFDLLLNERGEVLATLKLSHTISDSEKADIAKKLDEILKKKIKISFSVDPSLLVGSILQIGSTMIDTSAKTKLNNLFNK